MDTLSIHQAVNQGAYDIVKVKLDQDRNLVNSQDYYNNTPLHYAVKQENIKITELLLQKGADPSLKNNEGYTALYLGLSGGDEEILKALLIYKADPNALDNKGNNSIKNLMDMMGEASFKHQIDPMTGKVFLTKKRQGNDFYQHAIQCLELLIRAGTDFDRRYFSYSTKFNNIANADITRNKDGSITYNTDIAMLQLLLGGLTKDKQDATHNNVILFLLYPQVESFIENSLHFKNTVTDQLAYLGTKLIRHILLQPQEDIEKFLAIANEIYKLRLHANIRLSRLPQEIMNTILEYTADFSENYSVPSIQRLSAQKT